MATVVMFPSVLGVRPGIDDAAGRLRSAGHEVHVIDLNEGVVFDDYEPAMARVEEVGFATLLERAVAAVSDLPDGFVPAGFSIGAAMAGYVACRRQVPGVLMFAGAFDPSWFDLAWPHGVPGQIHTTVGDPWREEGEIESGAAAIEAAGGTAEVFEYPGDGHLFADPSLPKEYDVGAAELMWSRVAEFLERLDG
jgi:dienelactone hydrolase